MLQANFELHSNSFSCQKTTINRPQSAEIDAIRRLACDGKLSAARSRVAALRRRFPGHHPLLARASEIEDKAGATWAAAGRAFDWAQASPGSEDAQAALGTAAFASGLPALGAARALRLEAMRGKPVQAMHGMPSPLGHLSSDETVLTNISRLLLQDGPYAEVIERLTDASHPSLRNNLALAHFANGDVARAEDEFEEN